MSAATQEKTGPVTFRAKGANFRMVIKASRSVVQQDGSREPVPGRTIEFAEQPIKGEFTTDDPALIKEIRSRPGLNNDFWEVGNEPFAQPDPEIVLDQILQATIDLDDDALQEIEVAEAASFKRPVVLKNVRKARARVQSRLEEDAALAGLSDGLDPEQEAAAARAAELAEAERERELEELRAKVAAAEARASNAEEQLEQVTAPEPAPPADDPAPAAEVPAAKKTTTAKG